MTDRASFTFNQQTQGEVGMRRKKLREKIQPHDRLNTQIVRTRRAGRFLSVNNKLAPEALNLRPAPFLRHVKCRH